MSSKPMPMINNEGLRILIHGKQSNLFDFLEDQTVEAPEPLKEAKISIEPKEIKISTLDYSDVPETNIEDLLSQMQGLIKSGVIKQTDKYFRLWLGYRPNVIKASFNDTYNVMAIAWSDSAIYYDIFNNGGEQMSTEDYLNACDVAGAYTKRAWQHFNDNKNITPANIIEFFKIKEHIRAVIFANGTKEECEKAAQVLIEWNRNHIKSLEELHADKRYDFIRIHRRKGEIESTRCMNGECIGGIMTREVAF